MNESDIDLLEFIVTISLCLIASAISFLMLAWMNRDWCRYCNQKLKPGQEACGPGVGINHNPPPPLDLKPGDIISFGPVKNNESNT